METNRYLTVQALTKYIKRKFDYDPHLQDIFVKGEISNFKRHSSGHLYFTLKDDKARILAVMFSMNANKLKFLPENGMNVLLRGEISVYEASGQYQIYVKEMQPDGIGGLYLAFEQLKEKLEKEGLFSKQYKKPIPTYPKVVGVITSPTGAAIRDILTTIKRRYPIAKIIVYPALVQGVQAGASVAKAIKTANDRKEADVLIVGRGGGSIEELWAFNEEIVARAIFESKIPIISAVGHETDTTIADFVADLRAPTPTGAAELAVPHIEDLTERLLNRKLRLIRVMKENFNAEQTRLNRLMKSYAFRMPHRLFEQKLEQLDRTVERSKRQMLKLVQTEEQNLKALTARLSRNHPTQKVQQMLIEFERQQKSMNRAMDVILKKKQQQFVSSIQTLKALSPLKIMERGYSLIYDDNHELVKSVTQLEKGDQIEVSFIDGNIQAEITGKKELKRND